MKKTILLALINYKKVLPEDLHYQEAQDKISEIEELVINRAKNRIENGDPYEVLNIIVSTRNTLGIRRK